MRSGRTVSSAVWLQKEVILKDTTGKDAGRGRLICSMDCRLITLLRREHRLCHGGNYTVVDA
ncbi:hypothetical protein J6590_012852 [Homalodisca vitripennis]|nr:hypothetical protein J6590_012852 [Homalodisca vitripennis]